MVLLEVVLVAWVVAMADVTVRVPCLAEAMATVATMADVIAATATVVAVLAAMVIATAAEVTLDSAAQWVPAALPALVVAQAPHAVKGGLDNVHPNAAGKIQPSLVPARGTTTFWMFQVRDVVVPLAGTRLT